MSGARLDGWKAIAAHLKRDRTTVYRWFRDRGLPVHRVPGGKQGTVFAFTAELDAWLTRADGAEPAAPPPVPAPAPVPASPPRRWPAVSALALVALLAAIVTWAAIRSLAPSAAARLDVPADPAVAAAYLAAREDWARRDRDGLRRAASGFRQVIARDPDFAPAWAGLAEAYLLAREFGDLADAAAFPAAKRLAARAVALDPQLHSAYRAAGFVEYWWDRDPRSAGRAFRRALALAPGDAQSHFWYANILSDNGQPTRALRNIERSLALQPGNVPALVDYAWIQWAAGNDAVADRMFADLIRRVPDSAALQASLADVAVGRGDWRGYVDANAAHARLRGEAGLRRRAADLLAARGEGAIVAVALAQALTTSRTDPRATHALPAMIAAASGDRARLLAILDAARARGERWGDAGYRLRIARRWAGDRAIATRLAAVRPLHVE